MEPVDPLSGNTVPPGSLPAEVRDDVNIKASEGEYMLPADVVKYFGLDYIEKLVSKAKTGMEELQANGRIGGKIEEELPFSPEELVAHEQEMSAPVQQEPLVEQTPHMAEGGFVSKIKLQPLLQRNKGVLPLWLQDGAQTPVNPQSQTPSQTSTEEVVVKPPTGFGQRMDKWDTKDYVNYAKFQGGWGKKVTDKMVSGFSPILGSAIKSVTDHTNTNAGIAIEKMLKSGLDVSKKPLSKESRNSLQQAYNKLSEAEPEQKNLASKIITSLVTPRKEPVKTPTPTNSKNSSSSVKSKK